MKNKTMISLVIIVIFTLSVILINILIERNTLELKLSLCEERAATSITFREIKKEEELKIYSYIKHNYKRIPSSTADLIAKNTVKLAKELYIPISTIIGVMEIESSFNPCQVSNAKARGLMQVRWSVWKDVLKKETNMKSEFDLHEIDNGIRAGIIILKYYINKNDGDLSKALYDYVGKSENYVMKVYKSIGRFMLHE